MIPLVLTIALSFVSFLASAFVILRIVIPILPPHPLSRRVAPSEFGLPNYNFRSLSSADKSHLWLASFDLLALCVFIWQAVSEYSGGAAGLADSMDVAASARLWFALTIRQSCLLVVSGLILIHIRMGRSISFGRKHWMVWVPTLLLAFTSTTLAAVLAGAGVPSLFAGVIAYSATTAVLSTAAFGGLVYTLVLIKRNLAALNEPTDTWPPVKKAEEKPSPSFATEDIDGLREGSSWLTSDAGSSRHESMSNWSFSTRHTRQGSMRSLRLNPAVSQPSQQSKSSCWFSLPTSGTDPSIPPVPPLPSVYRGNASPTCVVSEDPDPFRRDVPSRPRLGSQTSWLSSPSVSQATLSAWSYPTTPVTSSAIDLNADLIPHTMPSRPTTPFAGSVVDVSAALLPYMLPSRSTSRSPTPALSSAKVLGGYGYVTDSEKGLASLAVTEGEINISYSRYAFWLLSIWAPVGLSLPYFISIASPPSGSIEALSIMLVLSVTVSSPLLALNILARSPIPIPTGLFGVHSEPPSVVMRAPSPIDTLGTYCREYKRSGSVTIAEGCRSGDVWVSQGDAVDGRGKLGRALGLITPLPKLAVLPPEEQQQQGEITPPLPMQEDTSNATVPPTPQSTNNAELGIIRKESKASSYFSGDEAFATKIMIAQRHYSAVATTVVLPASPEKAEGPNGLLGVSTGVDMVPTIIHMSSHLRSRSVSSVVDQVVPVADISAPPTQPLPPTPPNIRHAKQLLHRTSRSSDFSFRAAVNDDIKEIDALTAGVLPFLVPGLKLGEEMKIRDWVEFSPPLSSTITKKMPGAVAKAPVFEFGILGRDDLASPKFHSTPAQGRQNHAGKVSRHKRNHFSLPRYQEFSAPRSPASDFCSNLCSLAIDNDGVHAWKKDLNRELATKIGQYASLPIGGTNRRNTVWADEADPNLVARLETGCRVRQHAPTTGASLGRSMSTRNIALRVEIPQAVNSARTSLATLIPPSAASTVTLFETESIFEPIAESTPHDTQKGSRKHQAQVTTPKTSSRCSSIVYIKSDEKLTEPTTCLDRKTSPMAFVPPTAKPLVPKASVLQRKLTASESKLTAQSGGLRPLSLLKDRDTNKEGNAFKLAGTRPLVLGKKKRSKVTSDENARLDPANNHLNPLQLGRSNSSKMRGMLRRDEVLPTVVIRPPSTNAKTGSPYEHR